MIRPEISQKNTDIILKITAELEEFSFSPTQVTNILLSLLLSDLTSEQVRRAILSNSKSK